MSYRLSPLGSGTGLERLTEEGTLHSGILLERDTETRSPVFVRPVVGDAESSWVPGLAEAIGTVSGVVAFSGTDMEETASLAADAAAWLGDRGRSLVVLDGSIERPVLGKPLPEDGDEGLVDAVVFGVSPEAVTRRTLSTGVRVVTAGSYPLSIEEVFDGPGLPPVLDALSEENLVLLLVAPVHLFKVASLLSAAVCVAEDPADIESLAESIVEVRTVGVLVTGPGARTATERASEVSRGESTRVESSAPMAEPTEPEDPDASEREPVQTPVTEHVARQTPSEPVDEAVSDATLEQQPAAEAEEVRPVTLQRMDAERPVDPQRAVGPDLPEAAGAERPRRAPRGKRGPLAAVSVMILVALVVGWWFVDGQNRFSGDTDGSIGSLTDRVVERTGSAPGEADSAGDEAVGEQSLEDEAGETGTAVSEDPLAAETQAEPTVGAPAAGRETAPTEVPPGARQQAPDSEIRGPGGRYRVMISSHYREVAAALESAEMEERGIASEVVQADLGDRGVWYRVVVTGGYPSLSDARSVLDTIKSFGYEGAWIERTPESR